MAWLLIIFGPPLILAALGLILAASRRPRPVGIVLGLVGVGQMVLTLVSFSACTPFDADPCHGSSWWVSWPEVVIGWSLAVALLLAAALVGIAKGMTPRRRSRH